jgi:hypothetical protein
MAGVGCAGTKPDVQGGNVADRQGQAPQNEAKVPWQQRHHFAVRPRSNGEPRSCEGFGGPEKGFPSLVIGPACPTIPDVGGRGKRLSGTLGKGEG